MMGYHIQLPDGAYHVVTALEHCAWPNLTPMPNGEIGAVIYSHPSHGWHEGDPELWVSADGGYTWALRSEVTEHEPPTVRMNVAAGLNAQGHLVALVSGWSLQGEERGGRGHVLKPWVCISTDEGHTWEQVGEVAPAAGELPGFQDAPTLIPFGDVCPAGDEVVVSCYGSADWETDSRRHSVLLRSADGGRTWGDGSIIGEGNYNETDILVHSSGRWLALCRTWGVRTDEPGVVLPANVRLFVSEDRGRTWQPSHHLGLPGQHPGHLLELGDGRVLASYGSRIPRFRGVCGRISDDAGETWSAPFVIVGGLLEGDLGYPSSVQVDDDEIVTCYYSNCSPWHQRYHMGVVRWSLDAVPLD
ncbi:MAG: sialidase family protein [Armatimonadota bacterium]|nr:sialidase family protein [Armatimonadota bacterium]